MEKIDQEPKLRHEFVGMMFAVTIGEVGLQVAALVQAHRVAHFLPAYSHLCLASIVIATSWVGWSLSQVPGARQDVKGVFTWQFVTLLLDVFLVITYFILVRTVEFGKANEQPRIDSAQTVAWWIALMFFVYLLWDCVTKIAVYLNKPDGDWMRNYGLRMLPTIICFLLSSMIWWEVRNADLLHYISTDMALLGVVLLFRTLKDVITYKVPRTNQATAKHLSEQERAALASWPMRWSVLCIVGIGLGTCATRFSWNLPLPKEIVNQIQSTSSALEESPSTKQIVLTPSPTKSEREIGPHSH